MVDVEKSTRLARLLVSPPANIYAELRAYSAEVQADPYGTASDELEQLLAAKDEPLVDLALASYGASEDVVGKLYRKAKAPAAGDADAKYKQGLRLGVLGNQTVATRRFLNRFPESAIGKEEVTFVLRKADWIEAQTLIQNRQVADDVLLDLYRGQGLAEGLDEDRRRELIATSSRNDRIHCDESNEFGLDLGHWDLHKAIFEMLETVPTSDRWASTLAYFLDSLDPDQVKTRSDDIDQVLSRWLTNENGEVQSPDDEDTHTQTGLTVRNELRILISALYGKTWKGRGVIHGSVDDADIARRCAFYGNSKLDTKAIKEGCEKDGAAFVLATLKNDGVLLDRRTRQAFEDCLGGGILPRYRRRCAQLHARWPGFDPRPTTEWMVEDEKDDPRHPNAALTEPLMDLRARVINIEKSVTVVYWILIGVALLVVWFR